MYRGREENCGTKKAIRGCNAKSTSMRWPRRLWAQISAQIDIRRSNANFSKKSPRGGDSPRPNSVATNPPSDQRKSPPRRRHGDAIAGVPGSDLLPARLPERLPAANESKRESRSTDWPRGSGDRDISRLHHEPPNHTAHCACFQ